VRLALQARPWANPRQNTNCVCRRFASESFSFVLFVIHAEASLANASTGIGLLQLRMERRIGFRRTPFYERLCRRRFK
jgi:hypothetical protein